MAANGNAIYENHAFAGDEVADGVNIHGNGVRKKASVTRTEVDDNANNEQLEGTEPGPPLWDTFGLRPKVEYHADSDFWFNVCRVAKVVTIALCFWLIVISGVMSKLTLSLIATNLNSTLSCRCNTNCGKCVAINNGTEETSPYSKKRTVLWNWSLILVICFPYSITLLRHLWKSISFTRPRWYGFTVLITAVVTETLHSIGVVILTTMVLPKLDMFHSILIFLGLGIIPSLLKALNKESDSDRQALHITKNVLALIGQITALFAYPITFFMNDTVTNKPPQFNGQLLGYLVSLLLMSVHWWPNYFDECTVTCQRLSDLVLQCSAGNLSRKKKYKYRRLIGSSSSILQVVANTIKIVTTFLGVVASVSVRSGVALSDFFDLSAVNVTCSSDRGCKDKVEFLSSASNDLTPIYIALVCISSSLVCYYITLHAVKSKFPAASVTLPLLLLTPVSLIFIIIAEAFPDYFGINSHPMIMFNLLDNKWFGEKLQWTMCWVPIMCISIVWFLSQLAATSHAWSKPLKKIPSAERLYLLPMFDAECIEQSLLYNRKVEKSRRKKKHDDDAMTTEMRGRSATALSEYYEDVTTKLSAPADIDKEKSRYWRDPYTTQIYFCATMWHETKREMLLMMKSVLRMDFDHYLRRSAQELSKKAKSDFYNFETHIFFDDAFKPHDNNGGDFTVNDYVQTLVEVVPEAVRMHYNKELNIAVKDPVKIPTPYGGRLEWELPSHTKLIAHLKDKVKIRHKKRWSQVMYMYYFLGELLVNNPVFTELEKAIAGRNTYLLALDGDVDFKPEAVLLLVDMMKKNEKVGAACGRIHPIGSGPIVWYQKFEYAMAHWLQKATEHVLGCVLCSPGCFSLFRAEAIMQDNVMAKYATVSTKASHYLQYDQGEDRWLCTLLLQAGYKVEYNAAADALTFAPEGFDEFFNQRRRWGPSTMANIMDLIMDAQNVIRTNGDMSLLYIIYQAVQFFASIIGPGTIFLMITGAVSVTLNLDLTLCLVINLIPNVLFIIVSFFVESSMQLKIAKVMAIIYALIMCLVLISIILGIRQNPCSPTAVFFFTVAGVFVVSAFMHPQEFTCVLHGLTYYILIPCMYMLLIFYSFININNVSWGTRETAPTPTEQQQAAEKAAQDKAKENSRRKSFVDVISSIWKGGDSGGETDGHKLALGDVCQVVCCPKSSKEKRNEEYWQINKKLDKLTNLVHDRLLPGTNDGTSCVTSSDDDDQLEADEAYDDFVEHPAITVQPSTKILKRQSTRRKKPAHVTIRQNRNDMINPFWAEDAKTGDGEVQLIDSEETEFWEQFIAKYLAPLDKSIVQQEKIEQQLQTLRINVNFAFFLTNAMFITIVFTLQQHSGQLSFEWPCGDADLDVEPLSLMFLVFFMSVLGIQFIGMIVHRLGTFWHILATTPLKKPEKDPNGQWLKILKNEANPNDEDDDDEGFSDDDTMSRGSSDTEEDRARQDFSRHTSNLLRRSRRTKKASQTVNTSLDEAFKPKLEALTRETDEALEQRFLSLPGKERRATVKFLKTHKSSIADVSRSRSPSESLGVLRHAPSTSGLHRPGNRHSSALET